LQSLVIDQPSLAKRVKAAAPEPNGRRRAMRHASYGSASHAAHRTRNASLRRALSHLSNWQISCARFVKIGPPFSHRRFGGPIAQNGLREIVAQKNVDADALLVRHDRLGQAMRQQDARRRPRFVTGILTDDGIDRAVQQVPAGVLGQFMGDPDDIAGPAGVRQGRGNAPIAGTGAIDAEQIGMPFQELRRQHPGALAVVAPFERRPPGAQ